MPNIVFECASLPKDTKKELVQTLTKVSSEITSIPESSYRVLIKEFPVENWGIGGVPLDELMKEKK